MGPGRYPQYTRADFGPEAVGSSNHKHDTSPNVKPFGRVKSRMVAEPKFQSDPRHSTRSSLSKRVLFRKTVEPDTTEAESELEPAAESPAEDLNAEKSR